MGWDVTYQGGKFAQRGYAMLREGMRLTPFDIFVSQGGFNPDVVAASAGTHDREAWDISGSLLTPGQRTTVETNYRKVGCFAAVRTPAQGFSSYHIHVIPIGGDLSPAAADQVRAYKAGRNGLANNGPDTGDRSYVNVTWESYTGSSAYRPPIDTGGGSPPPQEDDMFNPTDEARLNAVYATVPDTQKRIQDLQTEVASLKTVVDNVQWTSNAAYANAGQVLAEFRAFVAYQQSDDKANFDRDAAVKDELDKILAQTQPQPAPADGA